ncbi:MAG TPA: carbon-phosphorus lyase, partial [Tistrella mobilis]|nr:carbon-phosphorus lyase [Tistrella mobilis]
MTSPATTTVLAADADGSSVDGYNFAYLDEQTKRMIRR